MEVIKEARNPHLGAKTHGSKTNKDKEVGVALLKVANGVKDLNKILGTEEANR